MHMDKSAVIAGEGVWLEVGEGIRGINGNEKNTINMNYYNILKRRRISKCQQQSIRASRRAC